MFCGAIQGRKYDYFRHFDENQSEIFAVFTIKSEKRPDFPSILFLPNGQEVWQTFNSKENDLALSVIADAMPPPPKWEVLAVPEKFIFG